MSNIVQQEAEFTRQLEIAAEKACGMYNRSEVCVFSSNRFGTLIFPDEATALEAARAAASRFDIFSYQLGLDISLSAVEDFVRDNCITYYRTDMIEDEPFESFGGD